jgi:multidrug efflux pump subunit AcrA (membrane-fusion protein)
VQKRVTNLESQFSLLRTNSATIDAQLQASYRRIDATINGFIGLGASGSGFTINADNIIGGTITGTTLQTSATGQRVEVSNLDQIKFYNSSGALSGTMEGTAAAGESSLSIYSKSVVNTTLGAPGSMFVLADGGFSLTVSSPIQELGGIITIDDTGEAVFASDTSIRLTSGSINLNGFIINSNGSFNLGNLGDIDVTSIFSSGEINANGNVFGANITAKNSGGLFGGYVSVGGSISGGSVSVGGSISGGSISGTSIRSSGVLGRTELATGDITGASFNTNGNLFRTGSSIRFKTDVSDFELPYDSIINAPNPKIFRLKDEVFGSEEEGIAPNENARYYAGFIAEDFVDTDLNIFVSNDRKDGKVIPSGFYYPEFTSVLLLAVKHQDKLIKSLTDRIETLEKGA